MTALIFSSLTALPQLAEARAQKRQTSNYGKSNKKKLAKNRAQGKYAKNKKKTSRSLASTKGKHKKKTLASNKKHKRSRH